MKMLGKACPTGPGGRDCVCCGQAPGKARTQARRVQKRRERQAWKREV
jgi:hypothetical protein